MARQLKLDDELRDRIALLIRAGVTVEIAAQAAGIAESTFYEWMERGRDAQSGQFREFYEAIEQARGEAESTRVVQIAQAANRGSWQAAAWMLERRYPERWVKPSRSQLAKGDEPEQPDDPFERLDELAERRQARG